jgi:hypothetical protein
MTQLTFFAPAKVYVVYSKDEDGEFTTALFHDPADAYRQGKKWWEEVMGYIKSHYSDAEIEEWQAEAVICIDKRYSRGEVPFCNYLSDIGYDQVWCDIKEIQ